MSGRVSNFSDLIQRVTASCLLHPLGSNRFNFCYNGDEEYEYQVDKFKDDEKEKAEEEDIGEVRVWEGTKNEANSVRVMEMVTLMYQVFEAVSAMKKAYANLQEAHCPWDPERMRLADVVVVAEIRRLGVLKERFRRCVQHAGGNGGGVRVAEVGMLREMVAPYEATVDEMKKEVKAKEVEVENLKEQLRTAANLSNSLGKKGKSHSKRRVGCIQAPVAIVPAPELFEATMCQLKETSKSFTSLLLSLMRSAHWDIAAAIRSIEAATAGTDTASANADATKSIVATSHAKYALESYISRKIFEGFDHETFYMDGSLSSLLNPEQYRRDCFTQYRDMKAMEPGELLGILPTCHFGKFCFKKYLSIVHPKMEELLFGNMEQRSQILLENHPRSQFYSEFLKLAKTVWLLHLLAFSLHPAPSQFEASRGAEFHPHYMESVVKFPGGQIPVGQYVGFPVSPGFKLGNGSVIKARTYLISRT